MASSLESVMGLESVHSIPSPATVKLSTAATLSWDYLNKLRASSDELFQPLLNNAGGLGIDLRTNDGWMMFTLVRKLKISEKKVHARFNGYYLLKRYDDQGNIYYAIVDLLPNSAWELVPFVTTKEQVEEINSRRNLVTHPSNFVAACNFADLTEENVEMILKNCDSLDLPISGTVEEIAQILGRAPVFPDDIQVGAPALPRAHNSPPPTRAAAGSPPRTSAAADKARLTDEEIAQISVTPKLKKTRNQPARDIQRPKHLSDFLVEYPGGNPSSILKHWKPLWQTNYLLKQMLQRILPQLALMQISRYRKSNLVTEQVVAHPRVLVYFRPVLFAE